MSDTVGTGTGGHFAAWAAAAALRHAGGAAPRAVESPEPSSNEVVQLRYADGRTLVVKRSPYAWAAPRYASARRAARLLKSAGVVAPVPLDLPPADDGLPVEAYWRIERPTLASLWPELDTDGRKRALRSWGVLLRKVHGVRLPRFGSLGGGRAGDTLLGFVEGDLRERLLPAARLGWGEGAAVVERLLDSAPAVAARAGPEPRLIHGDLHMGNVLCMVVGGRVRCVGLLDLEEAFGGPAEAEVAHAEVKHGPLLGQPLPDGWSRYLRSGFGARLDAALTAWFRACHMANLGFHAAAIAGLAEHAADLRRAAHAELDAAEAALASPPAERRKPRRRAVAVC